MGILQLLYVALIATEAIASHAHSQAIFNIREFESFIPKPMAEDLKRGISKSRWSADPRNHFQGYFVKQGNKTSEYICSIPRAQIDTIEEKESIQSNTQVDKTNDAKLLKAASEIIRDSFPKNNCIFTYDLRGFYWTYGYCYADKVIQYHEGVPPHERHKRHEATNPKTVYVLGRFTDASYKAVKIANQAKQRQIGQYETRRMKTLSLGEDKASPFSHHSAQKIVLEVIDSGSICEITLEPRSVEVIYKCDPDAHSFGQPQIIDVPEVTTCQYKMIIHVPGLCALEQFAPHRKIKESLVEMACQLVDDEISSEIEEQRFEEYISNVRLRDDGNFPVRGDNRISVEDHTLLPLGFGFYLAKAISGYRSTSAYYNNRNVIIYNGFSEELEDIGNQVGRAIYNAIGKKLLAPYFEKDEQKRLEWKDTFTIWLELYDFFGNFKCLLRISRDGREQAKSIQLQVIDPVTMVDIEGDPPMNMAIDLTEFEAPHNLWNYQYFRRGDVIMGPPELPKQHQEVTTTTETEKVIVTVTLSASDVESEPEEDIHFEDLSGDQSPQGEYINEENIKEVRGDPEGGPVEVVIEEDGIEHTYEVNMRE